MKEYFLLCSIPEQHQNISKNSCLDIVLVFICWQSPDLPLDAEDSFVEDFPGSFLLKLSRIRIPGFRFQLLKLFHKEVLSLFSFLKAPNLIIER